MACTADALTDAGCADAVVLGAGGAGFERQPAARPSTEPATAARRERVRGIGEAALRASERVRRVIDSGRVWTGGEAWSTPAAAMAIDLTAVGTKSAPRVFPYDDRATVLYALAIGARRDELAYLFEGHGPRVYPTFGVIPTTDVVFDCLQRTGCDLSMIVHHAQELSVPAALPSSGTLTTVGEVSAIYDMKKLAQIVVDTSSSDESGKVVTTSRWTILVRGAGNFGGAPPPKKADEAPVPRDRPADFRVEQTTTTEQALLYRLTGDRNPLHADPEMAARVGFPQGPILHGLCTLGYTARALIVAALGGDGDRMVQIGAQFRRPVWPGDTLVTEGWALDDGRFALQTSVDGRPDPVLTSAWAVPRPAK